jgi:hypothetical protein
MKYTMTMQGGGLGKAKTERGACKCVFNKRTKRSVQLCFVGKSSKSRSGWQFKGSCRR